MLNKLNTLKLKQEIKTFLCDIDKTEIIDIIKKTSDLIKKTTLEDIGIFIIEESGYLKMLETA